MTQCLIGIVGGTGHLGRALARRWLKAGRAVLVGSRDAARAVEAAQALGAELGVPVEGTDNMTAAARADVVVVAVPFASQRATLEGLREPARGKVVIDATVPLMPPKVMRVQLPAPGAAALIAQDVLGPDVRVVAAFHSVAAHRLATDDAIECDVLVFGDDKEARAVAVDLARAAGLRGLHGGALANSAAAEALTSVLIFINKHYAADGAGIRITGLREPIPDAAS